MGTYSARPSYFATVLDGIRTRVGDAVVVTHAEGVRISEPDEPSGNTIAAYQAPSPETDAELIEEAVATARGADTVVLVLGGNEALSREAFGSLMGPDPVYGDTDDLELPGRQNELVRQITELGKPTVAVLLNGRPYSIQQLSESVPAILEGWYLGQETGNAIAGILFGDVNPSGRLPVTIARNIGQLPAFHHRKPAARLSYVTNDNTPLYPFGHGLIYTTFAYGEPVLPRAQIDRTGTTTVSVEVTNTGRRKGAESRAAVRPPADQQRGAANPAPRRLRARAAGTGPDRNGQLRRRARAARDLGQLDGADRRVRDRRRDGGSERG